jgi:hypothetical protein
VWYVTVLAAHLLLLPVTLLLVTTAGAGPSQQPDFGSLHNSSISTGRRSSSKRISQYHCVYAGNLSAVGMESNTVQVITIPTGAAVSCTQALQLDNSCYKQGHMAAMQ